jgi:hypothetical protein
MSRYKMVTLPNGRRVMQAVPDEREPTRHERRDRELTEADRSRRHGRKEQDTGPRTVKSARQIREELGMAGRPVRIRGDAKEASPAPPAEGSAEEQIETQLEEQIETQLEEQMGVPVDLELNLELTQESQVVTFTCPVPGCGGGPFGSQKGLDAHGRAKHKAKG